MGKCISVNTTWDHPTQCLTYKCVLGESTGIARVSSDLWGKLKMKKATHIRRLFIFLVKVILLRNLTRMQNFIFVGCKDEFGKCHPFGKQRQSDKCVTTECQMRPEGPVFYPVEIGDKIPLIHILVKYLNRKNIKLYMSV